MRTARVFCLGSLILVLAGCGGKPAQEKAAPTPVPETYRVKLETSKGTVLVEVTKAWAPEGAERFYDFVVQFGINGDPAVEERWRDLTFADDPVKESNTRGTLTFAKAGPNSRTTQVFINLTDNTRLDASGFAPFGKVVEGMDVVERFYSSYGDAPPRGYGPDQRLIETEGNSYLDAKFPRLDYIKRAEIVPAAK
jgi:peptidyl-prolyl cis-trans isomerase A (cyclophilin A)